jgi:serine/threonine protein kinase
MTLGEQLELAIYRYVESVGKGQGRTVDLGAVRGLVASAQDVDSVDALIRLYDDRFVLLQKHDTGLPVPYADTDRAAFFYRGTFKITVTAAGRLDFERREEALASSKPAGNTRTRGGQLFCTALDEYEGLEVLGEGANGTVHKVRNGEGRQFALKVLRKELLGGTKQKRFQNELKFCMTAAHPNIISVRDHGLIGPDQVPFFVMPLYESTLRKAMKNGIVPNQVPGVLHQIALALEFAHQREVVHRDLKPENILCNSDLTTVIVADFGIAHFHANLLVAAVHTTEHERLANFAYAAPEQRAGGKIVGTAADIWALGLIVNELFTGQMPLGREHPLISSIAPEYTYLDRIVNEMLRHAPQDRPSVSNLKPYFLPDYRTTPPHMDMASNAGTSSTELTLSSPDDLELRVKQHPTIPGLIFTIVNRRNKNLSDCRVLIIDAQSFDARLSEYREGFGLGAKPLSRHSQILAGDETATNWLLCIRNGRLEVGDTVGEGALRWPSADASEIQVWRLGLAIEAQDIDPWPVRLTIEWNRNSNALTAYDAAETGHAHRKSGLANSDTLSSSSIFPPEPNEFWEQRKALPDTDIQRQIWKMPRWRIWIHPTEFKKARFQTVDHCREFMIGSYVRVKGWMPYPWFNADTLQTGSEWVAGEIDSTDGRMRRLERWALFRSGQFVHNRAFDEIKDLGDRIHVLEVLDTVTGAFELASRLAKRGILSHDAQVKFELFGVAGRALTWPLDVFGTQNAFQEDFWSQDEDFTVTKQQTAADLQSRPRELALDATLELLAHFGWSDPPREKLVTEQEKRFHSQ